VAPAYRSGPGEPAPADHAISSCQGNISDRYPVYLLLHGTGHVKFITGLLARQLQTAQHCVIQ